MSPVSLVATRAKSPPERREWPCWPPNNRPGGVPSARAEEPPLPAPPWANRRPGRGDLGALPGYPSRGFPLRVASARSRAAGSAIGHGRGNTHPDPNGAAVGGQAQRQWANWQGLTRASAVRGQVWGCQSYTATTTHMAATLATALCIASLWRGATSVVSAAASVTIKINRVAIAFPYNGGM